MILSPHPDDAAFSLGGAIAGGHLRQPCTVITVFGRSNYAGGIFFQADDVDRISAIRRIEDQAWARHVNIKLIYLDLPEASIRYGSGFDTIFEALPLDEIMSEAGIGEIRRLLAAFSPCLVFAPLAIGGHRDHVLVRNTALSLLDKAHLAFYEDLPYACEIDSDEQTRFRARTMNYARSVIIALDAGDMAKKMIGIACYASQIDSKLERDIAKYTGKLTGERVWIDASVR